MNRNDPDDHPGSARVSVGQGLLFPTTPRAICDEIGLNWFAAVKLWEDDWLSFNPEEVEQMDEAQEVELRFVGSMVVGGCPPDLMGKLLSTLDKPYRYQGCRIYYDWAAARWRLLPEHKYDHQAQFAEWLDELVRVKDLDTLEKLGGMVEQAIQETRRDGG